MPYFGVMCSKLHQNFKAFFSLKLNSPITYINCCKQHDMSSLGHVFSFVCTRVYLVLHDSGIDNLPITPINTVVTMKIP